MMKRNTDVIRLMSQGGATAHLVHRGLGTRSTCQISVATDRCKSSRDGGEVVIRNGIRGRRVMAVIRGSISACRVGVTGPRAEGGRAGQATMSTRNASVNRVGRLPVDGLETFVELG